MMNNLHTLVEAKSCVSADAFAWGTHGGADTANMRNVVEAVIQARRIIWDIFGEGK
jgi:hypothetical protein